MATYPDLAHTRAAICDPDPLEGEAIAAYLEAEGVSVDQYTDTHDADGPVDAMADGVYDAVLAETAFHDEPEFVAAAREGVPVRLLYSRTRDSDELYAAAADGFTPLSKEADRHRLLDRLDRELRGERQDTMLEQRMQVLRHDLRNPLSVIAGYSTILAEAERMDAVSEYATHISRASDRMSQTLDAIPAGDRVRTEVPIYAFAEEAAGQAAAYTDVPVYTAFPRDSPLLAVDPQLADAIDNLVRNSDRHAHGTLVGVLGWEDADHVYLSVEDDGHGLPADTTDLLQPGQRGDRSAGEGLGLFVANAAVKESCGHLEAGRSERYGGARFTITLPKELPRRATPQQR